MIFVVRHIFYRNYVGLCLWPFIFLRNDSLRQDNTLINHERIHLRQQAELLLLFFYLFYFLEWILKSCWYRNFHKGYRNISFEREAYSQEKNLGYLAERTPYRFLKYVFSKPGNP